MLLPVGGEKVADTTHVNNTHVPASVCIYVVKNVKECDRVGDAALYDTEPFVYTGNDVMEKSVDHLIYLQQRISFLLGRNVSMMPLTNDEQNKFGSATTCCKCDESFTDQNYKVRHHSHITGLFIDAVRNSCNLQIKYKKRKRSEPLRNRTQPDDTKKPEVSNEVGFNYFIRVYRIMIARC
jgi:hypothetical protein